MDPLVRLSRRLVVGVVTVGLLSLPGLGDLGVVAPAAADPGDFDRVSVTDGGGQLADGFDGSEFSTSEKGRYVAFKSRSVELGVTNGKYQAFWHDRETGETRLVSQGPDGISQQGVSTVTISADGRHVGFSAKMATGEEMDPTNEAEFNSHSYYSMFVWDADNPAVVRRRNAELYDRADPGEDPDPYPVKCSSGKMALSRDGSRVAMDCDSVGMTVAISGVGLVFPEDGSSGYVNDLGSMSANGQWITFTTHKQLSPVVHTENPGLYRVNVNGGSPVLVNIDPSGAQLRVSALWDSGNVSDDGRVVMAAKPSGTSGGYGTWVSSPSGAVQVTECNTLLRAASISPNGRWVAYRQTSCGISGVHVYDFSTGERFIVAEDAITSNQPQGSAVSNKGEVLFKTTDEQALVPADTNDEDDLYMGRPVPIADYLLQSVIEQLLGLVADAVGDPVNPVTGNVVEQYTDLGFGPQVFGMGWTRTFNGLDTRRGLLGTGWSNSYAQELIADGDGVFTLIGADGKRVVFDPDGAGGWTSTPPIPAALSETGSGHEIAWDDGSTWAFDDTGRLESMSSWDGQTVTVNRDGAGRLSLVQSSTGVWIWVIYDWLGRVWQVRSSDGRIVVYGHGTTLQGFSALTSVTDPTGGHTTIGIDSGGRITEIVDPEGHLKVRHTYDGIGRAASQETPDGVIEFDYDDAAGETTVTYLATGQTSVYRWNQQGLVTQLVDPAGIAQTRTYDPDGRLVGAVDRRGGTLEWEYDTGGRLVSSTDRTGIETTTTWDTADRPISVTTDGATTSYTYTGTDRLPATVTDPTGATTTLTHSNGLITQVVDADGITTSFGYDSARNATTVTDGAGNTSAIAYDTAGRPVSVTTPMGHTATYVYDAAGRVASVTDPTGATTTMGYDDAGNLVNTSDPTGATETRTYDTDGRLATIVDPAGNTTAYSYDADGQLDTVTNPAGGVSDSDHGTLGRLDQNTTAAGVTTGHGYDADGNRVSSTTGADTWATQYDPEGRPIVSTRPGGESSTTSYDNKGRVASVTDPSGEITSYGYDQAGRQTAVTAPDGAVTTTAYTTAGRVASITGPDGAVTAYGYDTAGRQVTVTDPAGGITTTVYNADSETVSVTTAAGLVTGFAYDPAGRTTGVTGPDGGTTSYSYTARGELAAVSNPAGETTSYAYDPAGRMTSVTNPLGHTVSYGYDDLGNRTSRTNHAGHTETWAYDTAGRITTSTDPLGNTTTYTYDTHGRLDTTTQPSGRTLDRAYDPNGRLSAVTATDGAVVSNETRSYDLNGRLATLTADSATTAYTHDQVGRLTSRTDPDGDVHSYTYDPAGRVTSQTDPTGTTVTYGYDLLGRIDEVVDPVAGTATFAYDPDGRITSEDLPGTTEDRGYTYTAGRLTGYTQGPDTYTLAHDPAGRITAQTGPETWTYGYDPAGQLTSATRNGIDSWAFTYDTSGNLTTEDAPGTDADWASTFDTANQLVSRTAAVTETFTYDPDGRLLAHANPSETYTYTHDPWGRQTSLDHTSPSGTITETHDYQPGGQLDTLTYTTSAGTDTWDLEWDTSPVAQLTAWTDTTSGTTTRFVGGPTSRLFAVTGTTVAPFAYRPDQTPIATPATSGLVAAAPVDPYGDTDTNPTTPIFGYRSELNTHTQLHLRNRNYSPDLRRFTTHDPLDGTTGTTVETNPYHYTNNNPTNLTDPNGLSPIDLIFRIGGIDAPTVIGFLDADSLRPVLECAVQPQCSGPLATGVGVAATASTTAAVVIAVVGAAIAAAVSAVWCGTDDGIWSDAFALLNPACKLGKDISALVDLLTKESDEPSTPPIAVLEAIDPTTEPDLDSEECTAPQTPGDDCGLPVFMPGGDTPDTTRHIVDALSSNSGWSVLTRAEHPDSTTNRRWYQGDSRCAGEVGDALSCDEYPFYTSRQGGPGASLRLVPGWEQDKQGGFLSAFYGACGIGQGDDYVVAPMPSQPTTTFRC